ncbi:hypothetical protein BC008_33985 [Mastigocoleus testarum BC008]|uniref:Uncharacterized protein n=1 Tax=Mastigocoleus testarum BC008 TaxID=371196 RepID=A0A0V7ZVW9_9CYAN|nr:hypothetical protein BC008_32300 [Mastigocoleus testarum BC008]KST68773.1 hypothetical protein BC008_33985 [Mastigocoleus testarum BC008]
MKAMLSRYAFWSIAIFVLLLTELLEGEQNNKVIVPGLFRGVSPVLPAQVIILNSSTLISGSMHQVACRILNF